MRHVPTSAYYPGESVNHRMLPLAKMICFIILVAAVIFAGTVPEYIILGAFIAFMVYMSALKPSLALGSVRRLIILFIIILAMNTCFYGPEDPWVSFWIFKPSYSGLMQGINIVIRVISLLIIGNVMVLTTPPMALTMSLEYLFSPLRIFRVPVDQIAMILSVAIQFIPTLFKETDEIKTAQMARGARFDSRKLSQKAYAVLPLLIPIFISSFKRADELSVAMESRGYRVNHKRRRKKREPFARKDIIGIIICSAMCVFFIIFR